MSGSMQTYISPVLAKKGLRAFTFYGNTSTANNLTFA